MVSPEREVEGELADVLVGGLAPVIRRGLVSVLREDPGLQIMVEECDAGIARRMAQQSPAVVIVGEREERSLPHRIGRRSVVGILVVEPDPNYCDGMLLLAGGVSCLPLSASVGEILGAVHLIVRGGCVFLPGGGPGTVREDRNKARVLTRREIEVLELVSVGNSDAEIALRLRISVETVRSHIANLRRKLRVSSRRDLVGVVIPRSLARA